MSYSFVNTFWNCKKTKNCKSSRSFKGIIMFEFICVCHFPLESFVNISIKNIFWKLFYVSKIVIVGIMNFSVLKLLIGNVSALCKLPLRHCKRECFSVVRVTIALWLYVFWRCTDIHVSALCELPLRTADVYVSATIAALQTRMFPRCASYRWGTADMHVSALCELTLRHCKLPCFGIVRVTIAGAWELGCSHARPEHSALEMETIKTLL